MTIHASSKMRRMLVRVSGVDIGIWPRDKCCLSGLGWRVESVVPGGQCGRGRWRELSRETAAGDITPGQHPDNSSETTACDNNSSNSIISEIQCESCESHGDSGKCDV